MYIVQLEDNVWLMGGRGDPPRTTVIDSAIKFKGELKAKCALKRARRTRRFESARIIKISTDSVTVCKKQELN